jgi:hypothetical protein
MALSREFFGPLGAHLHSEVAEMSDDDLRAAHRVLTAMTIAMSAFEDDLRMGPDGSPKGSRHSNGGTDRRRG